MAADPNVVSYKLEGLDQLMRSLRDVPNNLRKKALTKALRAAGKVVLDEARARAPVLSGTARNRKAGTVKKAIKLRVSKMDKRQGNVGVFINVKPLTKAQIGTFKATAGKKASGATNPNDPYYWRWLEFGHKIVPRSSKRLKQRHMAATGRVAARPFLRPAADKLEEAKRVFERTVLPEIAALNKEK